MQTPLVRRLTALLFCALLLGCVPARADTRFALRPLPTKVPRALAPAGAAAPSVVGARTIGDPYAPELGNEGYYVQQYDLRLALDPAQTAVVGDVYIYGVAAAEGLVELSLDFVGFQVRVLTIDGAPAPFRREGAKLVINPPAPLRLGESFVLRVAYEGPPERRASPYIGFADHLGLFFPGNGSLYALSEPDGARYWFPANDHPRDKATFRFELTVPAGLTAVANGLLQAEQAGVMPDGRPATTFVWVHDRPMATYLALVAVGDYVRVDDVTPGGVRVRHYLFPTLVEPVVANAPRLNGAVDWLSERLGPYPFEAFGYVTASVPRVSMETQTMVLLSEGMVAESIMIHELIHMWFGNWVSLDSWGEMWRNEGFATYLTLLWLHRHAPDNLALELAAMEAAVADQPAAPALNNLPPEQLFSFHSYTRGALLARDLHQALGDERFYAGLRQYFALYGGGTASQAEFQAVMEAVAERPLDAIFEPWFTPSQPTSPQAMGQGSG